MTLEEQGAFGLQSVTDDEAITGLRWDTGLASGAQIDTAQIRLTARGNNSDPFTVRIRAQAADAGAAFTSATSDISSRPLTTAFVDWSIPAWGTSQYDASTWTPDLSTVVQEVVDRAGFSGVVVFVAERAPDTPTGRRRFRSYDDDPANAPLLVVNNPVAPEPEPPPPPSGDFGDGYDLFGLAGNESFSAASPTLKDGASITGDMLTYYRGVEHCWLSGTIEASGDRFRNAGQSTDHNLYDRLNQSWANAKARGGQRVQDPVLRMFRLTGDLRFLDYLVNGYNALVAGSNPMVVPWNNHDCSEIDSRTTFHCPVSSGNPWSPDLKVLHWISTDFRNGTDLLPLEQAKMWAIIIEFAWALYLNRGKTSPHGYDYTDLFDNVWGPRVQGFVNTWSGGDDTPGLNFRSNYRGCDGVTNGHGGIIDNVPSGSSVRQPSGKYPIFLRNEGHSGHNSVLLNYYLGRLGEAGGISIPNASDAVLAGRQMAQAMRTNSYKACPNAAHGDSLLSAQVRPFSDQSTHNIQRMTYSGHQGNTLATMWLSGAFRDIFTLSDMFKVGSAYSWAHFDSETGRTYRDMLRSTNDTLASSQCGMQAVDSSSEQTATSATIANLAGIAILFDPGGTKMSNIADNVVTSLSGGYATPFLGGTLSSLFTRDALLAVGDLE